jgi:hypothetical protein
MKKITRNNYELWFVDWKDNKLSEDEANLLFAFLSENEDLKAEFDAWINMDDDFKLEEEILPLNNDLISSLNLEFKQLEGINEDNYEEKIIAFYEGDLNKEEAENLILFVNQNPIIKKEFEIYGKIKLVPDQNIKLNETDLPYKTASILLFNRYTQYLVAASLLLFIVFWYALNNNTKPEMAENNVRKIEKTNEGSKKTEPVKKIENTETKTESKTSDFSNQKFDKQDYIKENNPEREYSSFTATEIILTEKIEIPSNNYNIQSIDNIMIGDSYIAHQNTKTDDGFLKPVEWIRKNTIEKISNKKSDKLIDKNDFQPMFAHALKETLGADLKIDKSEGKTKYYFGFKNFSIEN